MPTVMPSQRTSMHILCSGRQQAGAPTHLSGSSFANTSAWAAPLLADPSRNPSGLLEEESPEGCTASEEWVLSLAKRSK